MKYRPILAVLIVTFCTLVATPQTFAQQPAPNDDGFRSAPKKEIKIFTLTEMQAGDAAEVLSDVFAEMTDDDVSRVRFAVDERANSLIAVGAGNSLQTVEELLKKLDVRQPAPKHETAVIELKNIPASDAFNATDPLRLRNTRMETDRTTNSLIVNGPAEDIAAVKALVAELDVPQGLLQPVQIRIVWLIDSALAWEEPAPVPEDLRQTITKISQKFGLGDMNTAVQMVINNTQIGDGSFESTGGAMLHVGEARLEFSGRLMHGTNQLQIELSAHKEGSASKLCDLSTIIRAMPNRPVILGMTSVDSKPSLFVVEVMIDEL